MNPAKPPTSKQFEKELEKRSLDSIYLFTGEEDGEKEKFIKKIIDIAFEGDKDADYSVGRFHVENEEFQNAVDFVLSQSMFSSKKICVLQNIQNLKSKDRDVTLFNEMIASMPESNILIMTSPENKAPSFISGKIRNKIKTAQFWRYFENDLYSYIMRSVNNYGLKIERNAVNLLIELLGRDIKKIDSAIEKIAYSVDGLITPGVVEACVQFEKDVSVFEFIDALFKKEDKAFKLLAKIIENGTHELAILSLIFRQAEMIEKYFSLINEGLRQEEAVQKVGVFPKNRKNFLESAGNFSTEKIKDIFPLIFKADFRIKSSNYSNNILGNPIFELVSNVVI